MLYYVLNYVDRLLCAASWECCPVKRRKNCVCFQNFCDSVSNAFYENLSTSLQKSDGTSVVKVVFPCFRLRNGIDATFAPIFRCFACPENIIKELSVWFVALGPNFLKTIYGI